MIWCTRYLLPHSLFLSLSDTHFRFLMICKFDNHSLNLAILLPYCIYLPLSLSPLLLGLLEQYSTVQYQSFRKTTDENKMNFHRTHKHYHQSPITPPPRNPGSSVPQRLSSTICEAVNKKRKHYMKIFYDTRTVPQYTLPSPDHLKVSRSLRRRAQLYEGTG